MISKLSLRSGGQLVSVALAGFWCPTWVADLAPSQHFPLLLWCRPAPCFSPCPHDYILSWGTSASLVAVLLTVSIPGCGSLRRVCAERFWCLLRAAWWRKLLHHLWKQALGSAVQPEQGRARTTWTKVLDNSSEAENDVVDFFIFQCCSLCSLYVLS